MLDIDRLAYQSRLLHVSPLIKFAIYLSLLCVAMLGTPLIQGGVLLLMVPLTCLVSRMTLSSYLKWLLLPSFFLIFGVLSIALSVSWEAGSMSYVVSVSSLYVGITDQSIETANITFWRSLSALSVTYFFIFSTPFIQLLEIAKRCRFPDFLVEQILLIYRFIFIFIEEASIIYRAQSLRFGYDSVRESFHSLSILVGMLFDRVLQRHVQMTTALEVKCFHGKFYY